MQLHCQVLQPCVETAQLQRSPGLPLQSSSHCCFKCSISTEAWKLSDRHQSGAAQLFAQKGRECSLMSAVSLAARL